MKVMFGMKQALMSGGIFVGLLFALVSIDARVQERFHELVAGQGVNAFQSMLMLKVPRQRPKRRLRSMITASKQARPPRVWDRIRSPLEMPATAQNIDPPEAPGRPCAIVQPTEEACE